MSLHRIFAKKNVDGNINIDIADINHLVKVLNIKVGELIEIVINKEVFLCKVTSIENFNVEIIKKVDFNAELDCYIRLIYCIPKGDKLDLVIQKCTELGVNEIVLLNSERCVAKISDEKKLKKLIRFQEIAKNASEQSHRNSIPKIELILKSINDIYIYQANEFNYIAYENEHKSNYNKLLDDLPILRGKTINLLVGPEGGFSEREVEIANSFNFKNITLGKRILRSETAAIALIALLNFYLN